MVESSADDSQNLLIVIQQLYSEQTINDDQRDQLKDMIFDDDVKLLGLYARYSEEMDEMKQQIVHYINSDTFGEEAVGQAAADYAEQQTMTGGSSNELNELSSPVDCAMDVKKRRRMKAMQEKQAAAQAAQQAKADKIKSINLMDCDIGASPKLNPVLRKKGFHSPLAQGRDFDLTAKK